MSPRTARVVSSLTPVAGIVLVLVLAAVTTPDFYTEANLRLVMFQAGFIGVIAVGQTLVLLTGGIDLSIGAVMAVTAVVVASYADGSDGRLATAIVFAALCGLAIGLVNAGLVLLRGVPPFVATFAVFVLVQGGITAWTRGAPAGAIPPALGGLGAGVWLGVPVPLWVFAVVVAVGVVVLTRTSAGRRLYAAGSNRRAADLSGIRSRHVIAWAYVLAALLAVLGGLINVGYVGHVDAQLASSLNLDSVAAAVIGGIALTGGRGHLGQTVAGVVFLALLLVWMVQLDAGAGGRLTVEGAAILLAALLQRRGASYTGSGAPAGGGR